MSFPIKLGVSACLLGREVRFNGGHQLDRFITDTLGQYMEYVPVCPEVECGLGIPREAMRLVGAVEAPRLVTSHTHVDHTDRMINWAHKRLLELEKDDLCGFIFKSRSPSSGMERVKIYNEKGMADAKGVGLFAGAFMDRFPLLPVEDDGRLHDPVLRENFIERIFVFKRWRELLAGGENLGGLVDFHTKHKLQLLSHSPKHYRLMGSLVAHAREIPREELYARYQSLLMEAFRLKATPAKNANVLQHILGYFKKQLSGSEKQELLEIIDLYRNGYVPLIVPITLVNHYIRKYEQPYLKEQFYLHPHPVELKLRNHV